jgi:starch phosphorylase
VQPINDFIVVPSIPASLRPFKEISYNLWWSWNPDAVGLFRRIDAGLWEEANHNPIRLLGMVGEERLNELATDDQCLSAYFSLEFAITASLPIYSGGLGALAGDHLKSASLGLVCWALPQ